MMRLLRLRFLAPLLLALAAPAAARADENSTIYTYPTGYPWNTVSCVGIGEYGRGRGSAVLVGPYMALTAGHVVYSFKNQDWHTIKSVAPGQYVSGSTIVQPYGAKAPVRLATNTSWQETGETQYDYGALFFGSAFSHSTFMPVVFDYDPYFVNVAGYPVEDCPFDDRYDYHAMWWDSGKVTDLARRVVWYEFFLGGGASGCPVWVYNSSSGRRLVGINVAHNADGEGIASRTCANNEDLIETWLDWRPATAATSLSWSELSLKRTLLDGRAVPVLSKDGLKLADAAAPLAAGAKPARTVVQYIEGTLYKWHEFEVERTGGTKGLVVKMVRPRAATLSADEAQVLLSASRTFESLAPQPPAADRVVMPVPAERPVPIETLDGARPSTLGIDAIGPERSIEKSLVAGARR